MEKRGVLTNFEINGMPRQFQKTISENRRCGDRKIVMPLCLAEEGQKVEIASINGKRLHEKLCSLGIRVGHTLQVVHNPWNGKILIAHEQTRLYLGGGAQKIQVVRKEGEQQ